MTGNSPLLRSVAKLILPPAILYSVFLLTRGHNLPGGGFIAGLLTASAVVLQYVADGRRLARNGAPTSPEILIGLGLLLAIATGFAALLFSHPFLTSTFTHIEIPLLGDFELATAMLFDLAVYTVVTGVTITILLAIEE